MTLTWGLPSDWNPTVVNATNSMTFDAAGDYEIKFPLGTPLAGNFSVYVPSGAPAGVRIAIVGAHVETSGAQEAPVVFNCQGVEFLHVEGFRLSGADNREGIRGDFRRFGSIIQLQNIEIESIYGSQEGAHADIVQIWAGPSTLRVDGIYGRTNYQGFILHPEQFGPWETNPDQFREWTIKNVWIRFPETGAGTPFYSWHYTGLPVINTENLYASRDGGGYIPPNIASGASGTWSAVNMGVAPALSSILQGTPGSGYSSPGYDLTGDPDPTEVTPPPPDETAPSSVTHSTFTLEGNWFGTGAERYTQQAAQAKIDVVIGEGGGTVSLIGHSPGPNRGFQEISVDGEIVAVIDNYVSGSYVLDNAWWTSGNLTAGLHSIVARNTLQKNAGSSSTYISVTGASTTNGQFYTPGTAPNTPPPETGTPVTLYKQSGRVLKIYDGIAYGARGFARSLRTLNAVSYSIQQSETATRTNPTPTSGKTLSGNATRIFVDPSENITSVTFELRDSGNSLVTIPNGVSLAADGSRSEAKAPYDLVGGVSGTNDAIPLDTYQLPNGSYTVNALIELADGGQQVVSANFTVSNTTEVAAGSPVNVNLVAGEGTVSASWAEPTNKGIPEFAGWDREWYEDQLLVAEHYETPRAKVDATRSITPGTEAMYRIRTYVVTASGTKLYSPWVSSPTVTVLGSTTPTDPGGGTTVQRARAGVYPLVGTHCGLRSGVEAGLVTVSPGVVTSGGSLMRRYRGSGTTTFRVSTPGATVTFRDFMVDHNGSANAVAFDLAEGATAILEWCEITGERNYTEARFAVGPPTRGRMILRRVHMHHVTEGIRWKGTAADGQGHIVEDSVIDEMTKIGNPDLASQSPPNGWNHVDAFQCSRTTCTGFIIRRSIVDARTVSGYGGGSGSGNAVFMHNGDVGELRGEIYECHLRGGGVAMNWLAKVSGMYTHDNYFDNFRYGAYWNGRNKGRWERNTYPPGHSLAGQLVRGDKGYVS